MKREKRFSVRFHTFLLLTAIILLIFRAGFLGARDLRIRFLPAATESEEAVLTLLKNSPRMTAMAAELDEMLMLPAPLTIVFGTSSGPEYDPWNRQISFPYHFIERLIPYLGAVPGSRELEALEIVEFVVLHEVGHALIDQLGIPVPGNEEQAVDALATVLAIEFVEGGEEIALAAADLFSIDGDGESSDHETSHWKAFKMDLVRYHHITCWVFGSDPGRFEWLAESAGGHPEKWEYCARDYSEIREAWLSLLETVMRF